MRTIAALAIGIFVTSSAAAAVRATITRQELASAINKADARIVPYRTTILSAAKIRAVRCIAPDEEPTEFQCTWQQRIKGRWVKRKAWLTVDENGWRVMDA